VKRSAILILVAIFALALASCGGQASDTKVDKLVVGFVPSQEAENLQAKSKPLADLLTNKLGVPVEVFVGTDYNGVIEAMGAKKVDIGFLNPVGYVVAKDKGYADVILLAERNGGKTYRSQFVVLKDSPIQKLEDLKGKKIAWVDPNSTSGYIYPAAMLKEKGIDPEKDVQGTYAGGHDKAIMALLRGDVDAAVSFDDARSIVAKSDPSVMEKTRILTYSSDIPNDTISVRSSLSQEWKDKIKQAFLDVAKDEQGKKVIKEIYSHDGYAEGKDSDFDVVRSTMKLMDIKLK